jgi:RNA polymerase sigma-70 factor (ECF subfamily)
MQRQVVERARSGDHEAFTELARAAKDRLYALAMLILRDGDRAQDAVQEALISAWRDVRALRNPDAWDAWLHRLTVRACYQLARKERRRTVVELHLEPDPGLATEADISASVAERDRLDRAIGRLPIDQRTIMVLHFHFDLPLTTAAAILDVPVGTAKSRLHYGLQTLRRAMHDEPEAAVARPRERLA